MIAGKADRSVFIIGGDQEIGPGKAGVGVCVKTLAAVVTRLAGIDIRL